MDWINKHKRAHKICKYGEFVAYLCTHTKAIQKEEKHACKQAHAIGTTYAKKDYSLPQVESTHSQSTHYHYTPTRNHVTSKANI